MLLHISKVKNERGLANISIVFQKQPLIIERILPLGSGF